MGGSSSQGSRPSQGGSRLLCKFGFRYKSGIGGGADAE